MLQSLWRCRTHAVPEPTTPSSSPSPQGYNIVYFSLSFWAYKSWFWYATLPHCFGMLHCFCSAALLWCATLSQLLWYDTLSLTCLIALLCYVATLLWYATLLFICCIALISYIAFVLLHCIDMLHCHIALIWYTLLLFCYILIYINACYIAQ
jgi:hypothetical protein